MKWTRIAQHHWPAGIVACTSLFAVWAIGAPAAIHETDLADKAGSTHELVASPDGDVWATQQTQAQLVRINPSTTPYTVDTFQLPSGSGPHGIAFDSGGRMWITLEFADAIAQVADGHIVRQYQIPQADAGPHGLAVDPDGTSIWWTGKEGDVIGRLDPASGDMELFPLPNTGSLPIYISAGADGNMWFTELTGSRIGRISQDGQLTEFQTPTLDSRPIAILSGPDGQEWFTEEAGHAFASIDEQGTILEHPVPTADALLAGLAFDASGGMWLNYSHPDLVARVNPDLSVDEYAIPTQDAVMHRIIEGPDHHSLWFTELASDKVGTLDPDQLPPPGTSN
jgi:virginiamycin B lyase